MAARHASGTFGSQSMVGRLRRVLVRSPGPLFGEADPELWHYSTQPDLARAREEHAALIALLADSGAEVIDLAGQPTESADAIYTHDPCIVTDSGAVLLNMGKPLRRCEVDELAKAFEQLGVPVHARLTGDARAEGGDLLWIDRRTLAAGRSFRTNAEGCRQLAEALVPLDAELIEVPLPYGGGSAACLHLMSLISMLDDDLAVVHRPWLPVPFVQLLEERDIELVDIAPEEFDAQAPNVLAVAPRDCIMLAGCPVTKNRLERAGCRVRTFVGEEISLKAEGGPTCLTRPLLRDCRD